MAQVWGYVFRCVWGMGYMCALCWKLLTIGLLLEYFATLLKRLHLKKIAIKYSIFLQFLYFFLMERSRIFLGMRIKFHLGREKGRDKKGHEGEGQNEIFLQNSHYLARYKLNPTNCWSNKLLTTTIVIGMPKNLYVGTFKCLWAVLPGQKQCCVFLRNKYGHQ